MKRPTPTPTSVVANAPRSSKPASISGTLVVAFAVLISLLVLGCAPSDPVERLQQTRAEYEVEAISFYVRDEPIPGAEPMAAEDEEGSAEGSADSTAGDEEGDEAEEPSVPTQPVLSLDILVSTTAPEPIPGLTVELEHVGADDSVKDTRQIFLDTSGVQKGISATETVKVEGVDYTEGDKFRVYVRTPVPAAEQSNYAEFEGVAP